MRRDVRKLLFSGLVLAGFLLLLGGLMLDVLTDFHRMALALGTCGVTLMFSSAIVNGLRIRHRARGESAE